MARLAAGARKRADGTLEKRFTVEGKRYSVYGKTAAELTEKETDLRRRIAILSSTSGYWIAENDGERERFKRMMKKQAFGRLQSIEAIEGGDNGQQANAFEDGHTE